jgi:hypothetical protein
MYFMSQRWKPVDLDMRSTSSTRKSRLAVGGGEINTITKTKQVLPLYIPNISIYIAYL